MALNSSTIINILSPKTITEAHADYSLLLLFPLAAVVMCQYSQNNCGKPKGKWFGS